MIGDGRAGVIVVWGDYRGYGVTGVDIYAQHVLPSGLVDPKWPAGGLIICALPGDQARPTIVSDGDGGAIVAWADRRPGHEAGKHDIYAQHLLAAGKLDPTWVMDGVLVCGARGDQSEPRAVSDGAGGAIISWQDPRSPGPDIYAQRVLASGVVDPAWPVDGCALTRAPGRQVGNQIVEDGSGGAIVTWTDTSGEQDDIYGQHVLSSGVVDPTWPVNGLPICVAREAQGNVAMIADGQGGAIVSWVDPRRAPSTFYTGYVDLYAQHVLGSGQVDPAWPQNGRPVCDAAEDQGVQVMTSDGSGGAILAWVDTREYLWDIYAGHVLPSGALDPGWPHQGRPIRTGLPGPTSTLAIVPDGHGGALIAWDDNRALSSDIYVQHVRASGEIHPAWPVNGRALCTASGDQYWPTMVADRPGNAIVAWEDHRNGDDGDIYARRLNGPSPTVPDQPLPISPRLRNTRPASIENSLSISFDLPTASQATVELFDLAGRSVRTLAVDRAFGAGAHEIAWDGKGRDGVALGKGVYLVRVRAGAESVTGKVLKLQ